MIIIYDICNITYNDFLFSIFVIMITGIIVMIHYYNDKYLRIQ